MRHPIILPNLGLIEAVTLVEWTRATGERVAQGDVIAIIETEKAQVEVEAPFDGILNVRIEPGPDLIAADAELGYIDD